MLIPRTDISSPPTSDDTQLFDKSYLLNCTPRKKQPRRLSDTTPPPYLLRKHQDQTTVLADVPPSNTIPHPLPPKLSSSLQDARSRTNSPNAFPLRQLPMPPTSYSQSPIRPDEMTSSTFIRTPPRSLASRKRSSPSSEGEVFEYDLMLPIPIQQPSPKRRRLSHRNAQSAPTAFTPIKRSSSPGPLWESATLVEETHSHPNLVVSDSSLWETTLAEVDKAPEASSPDSTHLSALPAISSSVVKEARVLRPHLRSSKNHRKFRAASNLLHTNPISLRLFVKVKQNTSVRNLGTKPLFGFWRRPKNGSSSPASG